MNPKDWETQLSTGLGNNVYIINVGTVKVWCSESELAILTCLKDIYLLPVATLQIIFTTWQLLQTNWHVITLPAHNQLCVHVLYYVLVCVICWVCVLNNLHLHVSCLSDSLKHLLIDMNILHIYITSVTECICLKFTPNRYNLGNMNTYIKCIILLYLL